MEEILKYYQELHDSLGSENLCQELAQKIVRIIQEAFDRIPDNARIAIRGAGKHTEELLKELDLSGKNVTGVFDRDKIAHEFCGYPLLFPSELYGSSPDYIVISNYFYRKEIKDELAASPVPVIDLYGELERNGIRLRGPAYMYTSDSPLVLGYYYWRYMDSPGEGTLKDFLQAALDQKNFVMISKVYTENGGADGRYPVLIEVWDGVQKLLNLIRRKLQARKQNDIILFWTDAVAYSDLNNMPQAKRRAETEGCFFKKTYTHTPYTNTTLQAMLCETLPIDGYPMIDHMIDRVNSPLLQYLEDKGYVFHCFGASEMKVAPDYLTEEQSFASNTVIWWHGLQALLRQEKPCFYILQMLTESRPPVVDPMQKYVNPDDVLYKRTEKTTAHQKAALSYFDQCLCVYDWLLGDKTYIQLSDHGFHWIDVVEAWDESLLHAYCFVKGRDIPVATISELFPYQKFGYLVRWMIDPQKNSLESVTDDSVRFQDTDYYNPMGIATYIKKGTPEQGLAYCGIVTNQYKYAINSIGDEFFFVYQDGEAVPTVLEDEQLRTELRRQCGTYFLDIRNLERFRYSGELYKAIRESDPNRGRPLWLTEENGLKDEMHEL